MWRSLFAFFLGSLAGLWEISLRPFLSPSTMFRPLLALVVLLLIGSRRSRALVAALGGALILDLYTVATFDLAVIRWIVLVLVLDTLLQHVFTNRSLYASLALTIAGRLFERATAWVFANLLSWLGATHYGFGKDGIWWLTFLWDLAFVALGFFILIFMTKRFGPFIPRRGRSVL